MSIFVKTLSTSLSVFLVCSPRLAIAADPWENARELQDQAIQAQRRGELEVAAHGFANAYKAAPDPCSSATLMLLFDTVEAHLLAAPKTGGDFLCGVEALVETATANPGCKANRADLAVAMRDLTKARRRSGGECPTIEPVLRGLGKDMPTAVETSAPAPEPTPARPASDRFEALDDSPDLKNRARLRAAGASLLGLGAGASIAALVGMLRGAKLEEQAATKVVARDDGCALATGLWGGCADLARDGKRMNQMAIGAGIAAAVLVITGAVLIATGARAQRRARHTTVAIQGAALTVRF